MKEIKKREPSLEKKVSSKRGRNKKWMGYVGGKSEKSMEIV